MSFVLLGILNSQAAGAGAAGAYDLLETQVLTSSASSVTFTGLGSYSDYKHLQIRLVARNNQSSTSEQEINLYFNSDFDTSHYNFHSLEGNGSSVSSSGVSTGAMKITEIPAGTETSNVFGAGVIDFLDFSSTNKNTTVRALSGKVGSSSPNVYLRSGLYNQTSAVTSIGLYRFSGDFIANSRFSLYGIKG